jgi:hypothetical protein
LAFVTGMLALDQVIIDLMNAYAVPGAALAVSRNGTVVIERGYGLLDLNDSEFAGDGGKFLSYRERQQADHRDGDTEISSPTRLACTTDIPSTGATRRCHA